MKHTFFPINVLRCMRCHRTKHFLFKWSQHEILYVLSFSQSMYHFTYFTRDNWSYLFHMIFFPSGDKTCSFDMVKRFLLPFTCLQRIKCRFNAFAGIDVILTTNDEQRITITSLYRLLSTFFIFQFGNVLSLPFNSFRVTFRAINSMQNLFCELLISN